MFSNKEGPMLSSKSRLPWLRSHKLLIWQPWHTVLTGEMYYDWRLNLAFSEMSFHQWTSVSTNFEGFVQNQLCYSFLLRWALCFSLWGTHSSHCWSFSHRILFATFWLAEAAVAIDGWEPLILAIITVPGAQCWLLNACVRHFIRIIKQGSHGLWRSLKVWGKWDTLFKALKVCENWVGSVKVCEFCGLQSAREKLSAYQSETALPQDRTVV